jgi:predicted MFS family arabinose efflux permease
MNNLTKIQRYLLWASFIGTFGEQLLTPLYGIFVTKIGGGILEAGIGFAVFSFITGLIIIITGKIKWFNDNTHLIVMLGFLFSGIGDFAYFFVTGPVSLFMVQVLTGLSVGLLNPAWESLYTKESKDGEEHEVWSLWGGGASISVGIAALVGSLVAYQWGFKSMFCLSALINSVAVLFSYWVYREHKTTY